jgi:hypothetical protein
MYRVVVNNHSVTANTEKIYVKLMFYYVPMWFKVFLYVQSSSK